MKEKLLNNLGLKVASLLLAFGVWMAVVNISNPVIDDSQQVTVEVRNGDVLKAANLTYDLGKDVITVSYRIRTRDRSLVKASDFHAYLDLKDYNVTGAVPVTVEVNKEKENLVKSDTVTAKPMVIRIVTEELQRKEFDLLVTAKGEPEEGYALGLITLSPDNVTVEGPESQIGKISHMGVEIEAEGKNGDFSGTVAPLYYDANGNLLDMGSRVAVNKSEIQYIVSVLKAKNLSLSFEVTGEVTNGYRFTGVECSVKALPVVGTKSVLASLSALTITSDKLNIEGAAGDKVVQLDLSQYLPPNTSVTGEEYKNVSVKLKVEALVTKVISLNPADLALGGEASDYDYGFDRETIEVTVKGLKEDLDALSGKDLNGTVNVNGMEPGTHPGTLKTALSGGFEILGYTPFQIVVGHKNPVPEEETTTAGTLEDEEAP